MINKNNLFWQVYLNLENELINLSKYIYFTDVNIKNNNTHQLDTFSPHIADLLVRCCVEIEAISKELYFDNGGTIERGSKDLFFDTNCLGLINELYKTNNIEVLVTSPHFNFTLEENLILKPLKNAHKRSKLLWAKSYQSVKHDRYNSLHLGNVKTFIQALSALYLLNIYYKKAKINCNYKDLRNLDMSFGSKIFCLQSPSTEDVINLKIIRNKNSPFVVKYTNKTYNSIISKIESGNQNLQKFWYIQPESKDDEFNKYLQDYLSKYNHSNIDSMDLLKVLFEFRLIKNIPIDLPFEERKKLFIATPEWNNPIRLNNKHLKENELTPENIEKEILISASLMAASIQFNTGVISFDLEFNGDCEILLDSGDIAYPTDTL